MTTKSEIHDMVTTRRQLLLTLNPLGSQTCHFFEIKKDLDNMEEEQEEEVCMVKVAIPFLPEREI